jgi:hypothetical protein
VTRLSPDYDVFVNVMGEQSVNVGTEGSGQRDKYVQADRSLTGLDPADGRSAEVGKTGKFG